MNNDIKDLISKSSDNQIPYSAQLQNERAKINVEERRHKENLAESRKANEISEKALKVSTEANKRSKRANWWAFISAIGTLGALILSIIAFIQSCKV